MAPTDVPIPLVMSIDVEPDALHIARDAPGGCDGFVAAHRWLSELRARLQDQKRQPVQFTWFLRMDPQIREAYGGAASIVDRYWRQIDEVRTAGDEVGLHIHFHRWSREANDWLLDYTDQRWVEDCARQALDAFATTFGRPCRTTHLGTWINERLLDVVDRAGVEFDVSVRPGQHVIRKYQAGGIARGALPSFGGAPRSPYHPSRTDLRRADPSNQVRLTLVPLTVGALALGWTPRGLVRRARHAWRGRLRDWPPVIPAYMTEARPRPNSFPELIDRAFAAGVRHLAFVNRSDFGVTKLGNVQAAMQALLARPEAARYVFTTPEHAAVLAERGERHVAVRT